jgi:hypothetical protein
LEESLLGWGKLKPAAGKPLPEKMAAGNCLDGSPLFSVE